MKSNVDSQSQHQTLENAQLPAWLFMLGMFAGPLLVPLVVPGFWGAWVHAVIQVLAPLIVPIVVSSGPLAAAAGLDALSARSGSAKLRWASTVAVWAAAGWSLFYLALILF